MLDFGAEAGLQILGADFDLIDTRVLFQGLQLPGLFCDVPVCTHIFQLVPLFGASVTRIGKNERFITVKQVLCLVQVVLVGCRGGKAVRDTGTRIHADMGFQPEVPLVALLRLMHFRITFAGAVLC